MCQVKQKIEKSKCAQLRAKGDLRKREDKLKAIILIFGGQNK